MILGIPCFHVLHLSPGLPVRRGEEAVEECVKIALPAPRYTASPLSWEDRQKRSEAHPEAIGEAQALDGGLLGKPGAAATPWTI